jgi:riboflavin synthase
LGNSTTNSVYQLSTLNYQLPRMFTGLVECTGEVVSLERQEGSARLRVHAEPLLDDLKLGDSVAVNGCCLTVTEIAGGVIAFDLLAETLARTSLNDVAPGVPVNLERAMRADGRLGGHFVQGHIDGTCEILRLQPVGADHRLEIALPPEYAGYVAYKGSICLDGISLTVAEVGEESFTVWIIPHTMAVTNLRIRRAGDAVNVEFDLLAKYLDRLLQVRQLK